MRDIAWRVGLTLMILSGLVMLGPNVSCDTAHHLLEQALGQTPQAQIATYLAAVAEGDREAALALWSLPRMPDAALETRRESVTDDLLAYGPQMEHGVLDVVWWRTCCEPGVVDDPDEAGGTRIRVAIRGEGRSERIYVFDLLVPEGYWGAASGYPIREWAIVDIYPESAAPLAWTRRR